MNDDLARHPRNWSTTFVVSILSLVVALAGAAYTVGSVVERINVLDERINVLENAENPVVSMVFGEWVLKTHSQEYVAETDGFVVVRSHGDTPPAESDFEILVEGSDGFRARTRGGEYDGVSCPVPRGKTWSVARGGSSNSGTMDVHWIPLLQQQQ